MGVFHGSEHPYREVNEWHFEHFYSISSCKNVQFMDLNFQSTPFRISCFFFLFRIFWVLNDPTTYSSNYATGLLDDVYVNSVSAFRMFELPNPALAITNLN